MYLDLLSDCGAYCLDKDTTIIPRLKEGMPMGFEEVLPTPPGVLIPKLPMETTEWDEDMEFPAQCDNYSSAETPENRAFLQQQFDEDVQEGMTLGPFISTLGAQHT